MTDLWVRRFHPSRPHAPRLVCLPHAGGSASWYHPMSAALAPGVEVLAVQYPGRQDRRREATIESLADLADRVTEALRPWQDRPMALFGHSMGAALGFEVARRFADLGWAPPLALFASGRRAPSRVRSEGVHLRDDDGLISEIRALSGTEAGVLGDEEMLRMVLPAIRGDYRAIETYRCRPGTPALTCPIVVLTGDADPLTTEDEAAAWREHTHGPFAMHVLSGGHFFLSAQPGRVIGTVSAALRAYSVGPVPALA